MPESRQDKCERLVGDLLDCEGGLSGKDIDFIESMADWLEGKRDFTDKQMNVIERIAERVL